MRARIHATPWSVPDADADRAVAGVRVGGDVITDLTGQPYPHAAPVQLVGTRRQMTGQRVVKSRTVVGDNSERSALAGPDPQPHQWPAVRQRIRDDLADGEHEAADGLRTVMLKRAWPSLDSGM